jgi:hypothetical protein
VCDSDTQTVSRSSTCSTGGTVSEAMLYAFDLLELDGENLRACRWSTARSGWRGCCAGTGSASS